jgi:hypothetical protein
MGTLRATWAHTGDGHWWPETYYLGSFQARRALSSVRIYVPICPTGHAVAMLNTAVYLSGVAKRRQSKRTYRGRGGKGGQKHLISYSKSDLPPPVGAAVAQCLGVDGSHIGLVHLERQGLFQIVMNDYASASPNSQASALTSGCSYPRRERNYMCELAAGKGTTSSPAVEKVLSRYWPTSCINFASFDVMTTGASRAQIVLGLIMTW